MTYTDKYLLEDTVILEITPGTYDLIFTEIDLLYLDYGIETAVPYKSGRYNAYGL
jgi:hypothetical protein